MKSLTDDNRVDQSLFHQEAGIHHLLAAQGRAVLDRQNSALQPVEQIDHPQASHRRESRDRKRESW
ncbi:hypothetical protein [Desulfonatronovibrio magnus]|uniref:hypothetical protein n=1 Tax=Desulfonatronovibrio magnus TaxID=698827 RepID=UPI0012F93CB0|nr:hypothetical protein [Desulfonatronovibrio magnus]